MSNVNVEQVLYELHIQLHPNGQCVQGNCRRRDTAGRLAPLVADKITEAQRPLLQAMWEALGILGFDQDGDKAPDARLGQGVDVFVEQFLNDMRQMRKDHDEALDEIKPLGPVVPDSQGCSHDAVEPDDYGAMRCSHCGLVF